ncbi:MAG: hypothetical protein DRO46_01295, partial [Candidatus Hecatellales archaeon]
FKSLTSKILAELEKIPPAEIERFQREGFLEVEVEDGRVKLGMGEISLVERLPENVVAEEFEGGKIYLDVERTKELLAEALAKELVRRAQVMRKELNLNIEEQVDVEVGFENLENVKLLKGLEDYLKREVRIRKLHLAGFTEVSEDGGYLKDWEIEGEKVRIVLRRVEG